MESRSVPEAIKSIMKMHGWSQARLARELGLSNDWVSKAKRGDRDPAIGRLSRRLARIGWEVVIRPKREKAPVKRRKFVTGITSVMFVPSPKVGPYEDPTNIRELAQRAFRARHEHGGGAIAATAMKHIRRVRSAVDGRDRQLQEAASELAVEAVWTLIDVRGFDTGENVGRLALELAKRSGNPIAQSRAYSALIATNVERDRPDRALTYAREAVRLPDIPEEQQAWMQLRKGRTLALVRGQEHASRDEVENVQALLLDRGFFGQSSVDVADMMGNIGVALNSMGAHAEALSMLDDAVVLLGASSPYSLSRCLAQQVTAALAMSQPSLAADRMLALASVAPYLDSRRLDGYLRDALAESARWATVPEIHDARGHLMHLAMG